MIDFSKVGTIVVHTINEKMCIELQPHDDKSISDMLQTLDVGLRQMNDDSALVRERGVLLNRQEYADKFPIPCVFIFEREKHV